jgi:hypothetical protein
MNETTTLQPAAATTLARWHRMIAARDLRLLPELLQPLVVFRSPMAFKPYEGATAVNLILNTVVTVFEDFVYHRELVGADGLNVVLEFRARVGDRQLKGVDIIRFDTDGLIVDFEVMVRPMSGLQALGEQMGKRLAPQLAALAAGNRTPSR